MGGSPNGNALAEIGDDRDVRFVRSQGFGAVLVGHVSTDGAAAETMDPAFTLLEVDRVRRCVPVDDRRYWWKSIPTWPALVVATTNGQKGLLTACRTSDGRWVLEASLC